FTPQSHTPIQTIPETVCDPTLPASGLGLPSPFRSPIATEVGPLPVPKSVFTPKLPSPLPSSTETVLEPASATARSGLPSPFRSLIATETGPSPVPNERGAAKSGPSVAVAGRNVPNRRLSGIGVIMHDRTPRHFWLTG